MGIAVATYGLVFGLPTIISTLVSIDPGGYDMGTRLTGLAII
jgi:hypothetical protein